MSIRGILNGVTELGYKPELGHTQPAQKHLQEGRRELQDLLPPIGLRVKVSGAAVNLPAIPWIAILNPDITTTAQSGLYVVYLYDKSLTRVFLTVNQGVTTHREAWRTRERPRGITIDKAAIDELKSESELIREGLPVRFQEATLGYISLDSTQFLPLAYEAGAIAAKAYDTDSLPSEESLRADLHLFLQIYDSAIAVRTNLTSLNPTKFYTPTAREKGQTETKGEDIFEPKSSADYIAQIAAHTQVRSRSHESLVAAFGQYAKQMGYEPVTNVHPRDMILRGEHEVLCEMKVVKANAEFAVREAIGQLFTYRYFYHSQNEHQPILLAIFSAPIGNAFVELLEQLGITSIWSLGGTSWDGSPSASVLGLLKSKNDRHRDNKIPSST